MVLRSFLERRENLRQTSSVRQVFPLMAAGADGPGRAQLRGDGDEPKQALESAGDDGPNLPEPTRGGEAPERDAALVGGGAPEQE